MDDGGPFSVLIPSVTESRDMGTDTQTQIHKHTYGDTTHTHSHTHTMVGGYKKDYITKRAGNTSPFELHGVSMKQPAYLMG